jgi:hypothetical protein
MRGAPAILAALLLAACSVDVEGARCRVPGATEDCPSGQACGNDLACSERALACEAAGTRCAPGAARCTASRDGVERCSGDDGACGAWVRVEACAAGLACGTRSGAAACECAEYAGPSLWADPLGGSLAGAFPFATGASSPAACRFRRLGEALDGAASLAATSGEALTVRPAAGGSSVFGDVATGETFPLVVAANVHLMGDASGAGPTVVRAEGATTAALLQLHGWLSGVRVESVPTAPPEGGLLAATGAGIVATCGSVDRPWMADVRVDGGGTLGTGVDVNVIAGKCGAILLDVDVSGIDGPALSVAGDPAAEHRVEVRGGAFRDSAVGVRVTGGRLTLGAAVASALDPGVDPDAAVEVTGNAGEGVVLTGDATRTLDVELLGALVAENGGTGLVVDVVKPDSRLTVRGTVVYANGDASPREYGPGSPRRPAGGVLVSQGALGQLVFDANRVSSNAGDQLAFESSGAWSIATGSCALANVFGCVGAGAYAVGVAGGGTVDASYTVWPSIPWASFASPGVTAPATAYCNTVAGAPAPPASCPAP